MRPSAPFQPADLAALHERLFCAADRVVPMRDIHAHETDPDTIGLRHDCDNVIDTAVHMAEWEAAHGYRSTYFPLHTARYWDNEPALRTALERIAELGHEIGIHNNAVSVFIETGRHPALVLEDAVTQLRGWGFTVTGTVAHGDAACRDRTGALRFVNDEMFRECVRETNAPETFGFVPVSLGYLGLDYDANWLPRREYLSDSGGVWSRPFDEVADGFPFLGQLHVLVHPDWWGQAFQSEAVAA